MRLNIEDTITKIPLLNILYKTTCLFLANSLDPQDVCIYASLISVYIPQCFFFNF